MVSAEDNRAKSRINSFNNLGKKVIQKAISSKDRSERRKCFRYAKGLYTDILEVAEERLDYYMKESQDKEAFAYHEVVQVVEAKLEAIDSELKVQDQADGNEMGDKAELHAPGKIEIPNLFQDMDINEQPAGSDAPAKPTQI